MTNYVIATAWIKARAYSKFLSSVCARVSDAGVGTAQAMLI